jgi:hypothetical protein
MQDYDWFSSVESSQDVVCMAVLKYNHEPGKEGHLESPGWAS